jgi:diadenosine tetraphosphatase ApaH/serine/threonine PP2A family protein phosphatase
MRCAILSDIHGNLEALQAVLDDVAGQDIDICLCLGDLVGYGADPNLCAQRIREVSHQVVAGNHDHAAVGKTDVSVFNPHARRAIAWTAKNLLPENVQYLSGLPYTARLDDLLLVHATPSDPAAWNYLLSRQAAKAEFDIFSDRICAIGHSHQPLVFSQTDGLSNWARQPLRCASGERYIVNVGSVGQPRDGDPRASYVIFDHQADTLQLRRVAYDIQGAQRKILQAGLPPILAVRLANGQ